MHRLNKAFEERMAQSDNVSDENGYVIPEVNRAAKLSGRNKYFEGEE